MKWFEFLILAAMVATILVLIFNSIVGRLRIEYALYWTKKHSYVIHGNGEKSVEPGHVFLKIIPFCGLEQTYSIDIDFSRRNGILKRAICALLLHRSGVFSAVKRIECTHTVEGVQRTSTSWAPHHW